MGFISNIFSKKSGSVIGVDIGSSSIKIVQLSKKGGRAILETYGELSLGSYAGVEIGRSTNLPPEKIAEAIKDIIIESKITTGNAGFAIPFASSLITAMDMPNVPEKQLEQMIPIEARKYIPVPITEVTMDWSIVPKTATKPIDFSSDEHKPQQGEQVEVMVVAIHNDILRRYQTIVNQAQLAASFFEIEIFSTIRSVLDPDVETQMIIDLGAATTKLYIVEQGVVRTSHIVNRGSQDITLALSKALGVTIETAEVYKRDLTQVPDDQKQNFAQIANISLDFIFSEIQRIIQGYHKKYNKDIPKVIMVGGGARLTGVLKIAETHLETQVVLGDPFEKSDAPAFLEEVLKNTGPEFTVAMGTALRKLQELN